MGEGTRGYRNSCEAHAKWPTYSYRKCPGYNFAESSIYLIAANIIATMDVSKAKDENGNLITPPHEGPPGFVQ